MRRLSNGALAFIVAISVWQLVIWLTGVPKFILPSPWLVATTLFEERELIAEHALITITEVLAGLLIGSVLGAATALHLMASPMARRLIQPIMVFSQAVPVFALAPILTLWLGYGIWSKIAMTTLIIYFPVASTFFDGLRRTPPGYIDLARCMDASPARVLFLLRVPAALPSLA